MSALKRMRKDFLHNWAGFSSIPCAMCTSLESCSLGPHTRTKSQENHQGRNWKEEWGSMYSTSFRSFSSTPVTNTPPENKPESNEQDPGEETAPGVEPVIAEGVELSESDSSERAPDPKGDMELAEASESFSAEESDELEMGEEKMYADYEDSVENSFEGSSIGHSEVTEGLSRLESAKDQDIYEEDRMFMPKMMPVDPVPRPGFIDFTRLENWQDVESEIDKAGIEVNVTHLTAAFTRLKQITPRCPDSRLDRFSDMIIKRIETVVPWQVASIFHACAKLRYINANLLDALAQEILRLKNTRAFYAMEMANLVYGLGILSRFNLLVLAAEKGIRVLDIYQLYSAQPPPVLFDHQEDFLEAISNELSVPHRLIDFKEQELANMVYGFGLLRYRKTPGLKALAREIMNQPRLSKFKPQEVSNMIYGFGLLGYHDDALFNTIADELLRSNCVGQFETQHLANILYGFARISFVHKSFIDQLCNEIIQPERLAAFREQELANIVSCLAMLGTGTTEVYNALLREVVKPDRLKRFVEHNLSTVVLGLATARHRDFKKLNTLVEEMGRPERMPNYATKDLCDLLVGFNGLDYVNQDFMLALGAELRKPHRLRRVDDRVWQACRAHTFSASLLMPFT